MTEDDIVAHYPLLGLNPNITVEYNEDEQPIPIGIVDQFGDPIYRFPPERPRMGFYIRED